MYWRMSRALTTRKPAPSRSRTGCTFTSGIEPRSAPFFASAFLGLAGQVRIEAVAAARLVEPRRADQHAIAADDQPLGVIRGIAADHADRQRLGDVLGDGQELRHRLEGSTEIVLV